MAPLLFVALIVVPLAELWVILRVGERIGVASTLAILIGVSLAGAWLLKQQGVATWRRLRSTLRSGRMPTDEVIDGALILTGGALLLTPGFLTDAVGLVLLIPVTRTSVKAVGRRWIAGRVERRLGTRSRVVPTTVVRRTGRDAASGTPPDRLPRSPREPVPRDEDGSRDTG